MTKVFKKSHNSLFLPKTNFNFFLKKTNLSFEGICLENNPNTPYFKYTHLSKLVKNDIVKHAPTLVTILLANMLIK